MVFCTEPFVCGFYLSVSSFCKEKRKNAHNSIVKYSFPKDDLNFSINRISDSGENKNPKTNVLEVFDYNGIKIMHENGIYTVNTGGEIEVYGSWQTLPSRYQRMVKEMDHRATGEKRPVSIIWKF
ncbi:hypothetical protein LEP1GSC123_4771 [Leptospira borgpetersenii str. 200701203]|uniref:Uncharacterized protein n=1 Tax=Leptospira borgpetersenii str. 200701203 TaxID=1193007 RepID=M3HNS1_LEPBO|nr:hypothetical protein LEP1GSC123_4771 [Leptospira borgpetersenii str. 200701203]